MNRVRDPFLGRSFSVTTCIDGYAVVDDSSGHPITPTMGYRDAVRERDALNYGGTATMLAEADRTLGRAA